VSVLRSGQFHDKMLCGAPNKGFSAHGPRVAPCRRCGRCHEGKCRVKEGLGCGNEPEVATDPPPAHDRPEPASD
jgi:hypothetical protein